MFERVTDPNILKQLSTTQSAVSQFEKVTDPTVVSQLNSGKNLFTVKPRTPEEKQKQIQETNEFMKGASQSYINTPEEAANVFGKHLYNKFNYAPQTEAAKQGGVAGDLASFMMPSNVFTGGLKGVSMIPKAGLAITDLSDALKATPLINHILKGMKNAGEAALFQKEKYPQSKPIDVLKAAGIGVGAPLVAGLTTSSNPLTSTLARLAAGGGLGYYYGGPTGALEGASAAVAIPRMLKEIGIGAPPVSTEFLTQPKNPLAQARVEAANRLNTPIRPSEAFNSPGIARNEGMISRSETGGQEMAEQGQQRIVQQKNAIKDLLKTIYPKTTKANQNIVNLYNQSYLHDMPQPQVNALLQDPLIAQAKNNVIKDPVYQRKLNNIPENNFAYLDQIKRNLNASGKRATAAGDNVAAEEYKDAEKKLVSEMDKITPDYEKARNASQLRIIRKQLEKALASKEITGTNFFNTALRNDTKYQKLLSDLKNSPEALQKVKDMKLAWEHLIGTETPRAAAGSSAKSMSTAREGFSSFWNMYKDLLGAPRDVERAKFIHDPRWWDKFDEVMKYHDRKAKIEALGNLVAKGIAPTTLVIPEVRKIEKRT